MKRIVLLLALVLGLNAAAGAEETVWKNDIGVGFDQSKGNTDLAQFNFAAGVAKGWAHSDFSDKFDLFYSSSNRKMDGQKWVNATRYALNFGKADRWFNPYQFMLDHDRFADIDIRYQPSVGLGYWFSTNDDFKWSVEGSLGYQVTEYRSDTETKRGMTLPLRTFLSKRVFEKSHLTEDLTFTPSLARNGNLIHSETGFINPLAKGLDLTMRYIIDYDSEPGEGKKKTDTRLVAGLKYRF